MRFNALAFSLLACAGLFGQDEVIQRKFFSDVHQALALKPGAIVADVGTGDDPLHALRIANVVGAGGRVVCVDIDQKALDKLRTSLPAETTNIEVHLGKSNDPLLRAASFDAVQISNAYHEMTEHAEMLAHIRQALKPGGRLVIIEAFVESRRHLPRDEQTKKHELSPDLLDAELRESGLEVVSRQEPLLLDGSNIRYLIAAQPAKSMQAPARPDPVSDLASTRVYDATREEYQRASVILRAMDLKSGDSAADLGAGGGYYTDRLSSIVGSKGRVFAVEVRETALALLKHRAAADHLENVVVVRGEEKNPHLEAGSLDAVLIVDAYHEMPEYEAILQQLYKALKPGGRLVIADYSDRPGRSQPREDQTKKHFLSPGLVSEELKRAGFEIMKLDDALLERKPDIKNARIGTADLWLLTARRPM
jgi:ubiquinone/menaquinone biosynthesis C-methylase UbiE